MQEDVQNGSERGKHRLVGFVDLGQIHDDMLTISGNRIFICTNLQDPYSSIAKFVYIFLYVMYKGASEQIAREQ